MSPKELEGRKRILQAALNLLAETDDPETITIRQIAGQAGVGVGLVNYHFQNKENLFNEAIAGLIGDMSSQWDRLLDPSINNPVDRIKTILKSNARGAVRNAKYMRIIIRYELLQGNFVTSQALLPALREIYSLRKDEIDLRMIAFTLVTSLQVAFLREKAFRIYAGVNFQVPEQVDKMVDSLVDDLISPG